MRFFTLFAPFLLASTSLAAPVEPREAADNVPTITTRRLTNYHPLSFSFNKHVSRLAFQPSNDNIVGCQEEHDAVPDTFEFIAVGSKYLGTEKFLEHGSKNESSSYYGILRSNNTGFCVAGQFEPEGPGESSPFLATNCSYVDDQSQALQTFRAVFHSGVSGGRIHAKPGSAVDATLYFSGPYPTMPTDSYYGSTNLTGSIYFNAMYDEGTLRLGPLA